MSLQITKSRAVGMSESFIPASTTFPKWGSVNPEAPAQAATEYRMKSVAERQARQMGMTGTYYDTLMGQLMSELHEKLLSERPPLDMEFKGLDALRNRPEVYGMRIQGNRLVSVNIMAPIDTIEVKVELVL